jgi:hypothetical protein
LLESEASVAHLALSFGLKGASTIGRFGSDALPMMVVGRFAQGGRLIIVGI